MRILYISLMLTGLAALPAAAQTSADAPEISKSAGPPGGVIVLWPRIIPRSETARTRELARGVQKRMETLVNRVLPGRPVDIRPEPERVCRRAGCEALAIGTLIARKGDGCVLLVTISRPGASPARMVPAVGKVERKREWLPFREPPESHIKIKDFARCDAVLSELTGSEGNIQKILHQAIPLPEKKSK